MVLMWWSTTCKRRAINYCSLRQETWNCFHSSVLYEEARRWPIVWMLAFFWHAVSWLGRWYGVNFWEHPDIDLWYSIRNEGRLDRTFSTRNDANPWTNFSWLNLQIVSALSTRAVSYLTSDNDDELDLMKDYGKVVHILRLYLNSKCRSSSFFARLWLARLVYSNCFHFYIHNDAMCYPPLVRWPISDFLTKLSRYQRLPFNDWMLAMK